MGYTECILGARTFPKTYQYEYQHRRDERAVEQAGRLHPHAEIGLRVGRRIDGQRNGYNAERQAVRQQIVPDDFRRFLHFQQNLLGGQRHVQLKACNDGGDCKLVVIIRFFQISFTENSHQQSRS